MLQRARTAAAGRSGIGLEMLEEAEAEVEEEGVD